VPLPSNGLVDYSARSLAGCTSRSGRDHGTSIAYAAWTNGACERAGLVDSACYLRLGCLHESLGEHGTSIAYAAWTNGACERAGRAALRLLRAVVSERRLPTEL
jgi:hypothetical protein